MILSHNFSKKNFDEDKLLISVILDRKLTPKARQDLLNTVFFNKLKADNSEPAYRFDLYFSSAPKNYLNLNSMISQKFSTSNSGNRISLSGKILPVLILEKKVHADIYDSLKESAKAIDFQAIDYLIRIETIYKEIGEYRVYENGKDITNSIKRENRLALQNIKQVEIIDLKTRLSVHTKNFYGSLPDPSFKQQGRYGIGIYSNMGTDPINDAVNHIKIILDRSRLMNKKNSEAAHADEG